MIPFYEQVHGPYHNRRIGGEIGLYQSGDGVRVIEDEKGVRVSSRDRLHHPPSGPSADECLARHPGREEARRFSSGFSWETMRKEQSYRRPNSRASVKR